MIRKKIRSFTITEMLVVMIITVIVVSITLLVLNIVQTEMGAIRSNYKKTAEIKALEQALWKDFNTSNLFFDKKSNQLQCKNPLDSVLYKFNDTFVVRNSDTLKVKIESLTFLLDGKQSVNEVDAVKILFSKEYLNKEIFVYKTKSSSYYMNK